MWCVTCASFGDGPWRWIGFATLNASETWNIHDDVSILSSFVNPLSQRSDPLMWKVELESTKERNSDPDFSRMFTTRMLLWTSTLRRVKFLTGGDATALTPKPTRRDEICLKFRKFSNNLTRPRRSTTTFGPKPTRPRYRVLLWTRPPSCWGRRNRPTPSPLHDNVKQEHLLDACFSRASRAAPLNSKEKMAMMMNIYLLHADMRILMEC